MKHPSVTQYVEYFTKYPPSNTAHAFLQKHYLAKDHAATMRELAMALGYKNYNAANLHYGTYAGKVADYFIQKRVLSADFKDKKCNIVLFVKKFVPEKELVLYMEDNLVKAIEKMRLVNLSARSHIKLPVLDSDDPVSYEEGNGVLKKVWRYERNTQARRECLNHYGYACAACGINFGERFGEEFEGLITAHHLEPVSFGGKRTTDPVSDMRPLCPNCHAMVHYQRGSNNPRSIDELKKNLR